MLGSDRVLTSLDSSGERETEAVKALEVLSSLAHGWLPLVQITSPLEVSIETPGPSLGPFLGT